MRVLVTGTTRGLGRYLFEQYSQYTEAHSFNRGDEIPDKYFDLIVHTAWDKEGMLELMDKLVRIPCKAFVFTSTVDIYQNDLLNSYTHAKLSCEQILRINTDNYLILRLGALVGQYMKRNNVVKMFAGELMTLSPESTFGFVTYKQVADLINQEVAFDFLGKTVDVLGQIQSLGELALRNNLKPLWGEYTYKTANIDNGFSARIGKLDIRELIK